MPPNGSRFCCCAAAEQQKMCHELGRADGGKRWLGRLSKPCRRGWLTQGKRTALARIAPPRATAMNKVELTTNNRRLSAVPWKMSRVQ